MCFVLTRCEGVVLDDISKVPNKQYHFNLRLSLSHKSFTRILLTIKILFMTQPDGIEHNIESIAVYLVKSLVTFPGLIMAKYSKFSVIVLSDIAWN